MPVCGYLSGCVVLHTPLPEGLSLRGREALDLLQQRSRIYSQSCSQSLIALQWLRLFCACYLRECGTLFVHNLHKLHATQFTAETTKVWNRE
jgi:hypothetical protein